MSDIKKLMPLPNEDVVREMSITIATMTRDKIVFGKVVTFHIYDEVIKLLS